jgi:spore coat protein U-like protein
MNSRPALLFAAFCIFPLTAIEARPATCAVSSSGVAFGNYDTLASLARDTLAAITVRCTGNVGEKVTYGIALNPGSHGSLDRSMLRKANQLNYMLFVDPARTQAWGNGTGGSSQITDSFYLDQTLTTRRYAIFARILGSQKTKPAGAYDDIATIILSQ